MGDRGFYLAQSTPAHPHSSIDARTDCTDLAVVLEDAEEREGRGVQGGPGREDKEGDG